MAYTGRELIAARCAKFFKDGDFVNLGIGVPTMCINYLPEGVDLWLETETGACGTGPTPPIDKWDTDYADAGSNPITLLPQGSWLPHDRSFGFIRGGHIDATVLGTLQVDQEGNIANWIIPGKLARPLREERQLQDPQEVHPAPDRLPLRHRYRHRALLLQGHSRRPRAHGAGPGLHR